MQLKKLSDTHYVVVTDGPIIYTNFSGLVYVNGEVRQYTEAFGITDANRNCKKITHSTEPLEDVVVFDVENREKGFYEIEQLDLSYIKSLVGEVDVEPKDIWEVEIIDGQLKLK